MNWDLFAWVGLSLLIGVGIEIGLAKGFKNVNWISVGLCVVLCAGGGFALCYWIDKEVVQTMLIVFAVLILYLACRNNISFKKNEQR